MNPNENNLADYAAGATSSPGQAPAVSAFKRAAIMKIEMDITGNIYQAFIAHLRKNVNAAADADGREYDAEVLAWAENCMKCEDVSEAFERWVEPIIEAGI